jgi:hypothetical protein
VTATARLGFASDKDAASAMLYLRSGVTWLKNATITQCDNRKFTTRIVHDLGALRCSKSITALCFVLFLLFVYFPRVAHHFL